MTIAYMSSMEAVEKKRHFKDVHLTILDLKAAALARTLIFFDMFATYAILKRRNVPGIEDAPTIMAYLYAGHLVPAAVNEKLQVHIEGLISALQTDEPLFDWLFVPAATRKKVVYVLKQWQKLMEGVWGTANVRRAIGKRLVIQEGRDFARFGDQFTYPTEDKMDRKAFGDWTVLLPSEGFAERRDPPLVNLMKNYKIGSKGSKIALGQHIDAHWVTNATIMDMDYCERTRENNNKEKLMGRPVMDDDHIPSIEADAILLAGKLPSPQQDPGTALELIGRFFDWVALSTVKIVSTHEGGSTGW